MKTPKDFNNFPANSATQNWESEQIAMNIMVILSRTGNTFRDLSFDEYTRERLKDGASQEAVEGEKLYFDKVIRYFKSADTAALFSPVWAETT